MDALRESLGDGEIGWAGALLFNETTGHLIDGHARKEAVDPETLVPVLIGKWSAEAERQILLTLDPITGMAEADGEALRALLEETSVQTAGLQGVLDGLWAELGASGGAGEGGAGGADETYSRKIEPPIYEPSDNPPAVAELVDTSKADSLKEKIDAAEIPEDVAAFLRTAADRHVKFDFHRIADFYASADVTVQDLMEQSALVIIDFNKAIENGFVEMSKTLCELAGREHPDA